VPRHLPWVTHLLESGTQQTLGKKQASRQYVI
jgi:hypothetical protein